jgi:hypothetical protein
MYMYAIQPCQDVRLFLIHNEEGSETIVNRKHKRTLNYLRQGQHV